MMKMEKKQVMKLMGIMLVLILAMPFALAGCGSNDSADTGEDVDVEYAEDGGEVEGALPADVLDMDGPLVIINSEGMGHVARAVEGTDPVIDEEYPADQTIDHVVKGTTLNILAEPYDDDWKFVKWTVNGEDYSTDAMTTITADEDLEINAYFEMNE
ncbi:MAG: hypothetical protein IJH92_06880 [Mogibacterium sp.]|nr:hypothetical protein [Mogibacterium sp.]